MITVGKGLHCTHGKKYIFGKKRYSSFQKYILFPGHRTSDILSPGWPQWCRTSNISSPACMQWCRTNNISSPVCLQQCRTSNISSPACLQWCNLSSAVISIPNLPSHNPCWCRLFPLLPAESTPAACWIISSRPVSNIIELSRLKSAKLTEVSVNLLWISRGFLELSDSSLQGGCSETKHRYKGSMVGLHEIKVLLVESSSSHGEKGKRALKIPFKMRTEPSGMTMSLSIWSRAYGSPEMGK